MLVMAPSTPAAKTGDLGLWRQGVMLWWGNTWLTGLVSELSQNRAYMDNLRDVRWAVAPGLLVTLCRPFGTTIIRTIVRRIFEILMPTPFLRPFLTTF